MIDTDNLTHLSRSYCLADLNDPSNRSHSEEVILQFPLEQKHIVSGDAAEEHLDPHLVVAQLRKGEGLRVDAAALDCESCCF